MVPNGSDKRRIAARRDTTAMGRKEPTPPPENAVKPSPPPAPPVRQNSAACSRPVDLMVIRKTLEREIASKQKSVDRLHRKGALEAAAREDAVREGLAWGLFVLSQKCSV